MNKKVKFLKDVEHEVKQLKITAHPSELAKLNFQLLDFESPTRCIYGQMAGACNNSRAKELMDASCVRVLHLSEGGTDDIAGVSISNPKFKINGKYEQQTWEGRERSREYSYLSALEGYICTKGAKNQHIIDFLKDTTNTIELNLVD